MLCSSLQLFKVNHDMVYKFSKYTLITPFARDCFKKFKNHYLGEGILYRINNPRAYKGYLKECYEIEHIFIEHLLIKKLWFILGKFGN